MAMDSNGWKMPVLHDYPYEDSTHFTYTDKQSVKNWILTDIIPIPNPYFIIAFSLGDIFIVMGFIFSLVTQIQILRESLK